MPTEEEGCSGCAAEVTGGGASQKGGVALLLALLVELVGVGEFPLLIVEGDSAATVRRRKDEDGVELQGLRVRVSVRWLWCFAERSDYKGKNKKLIFHLFCRPFTDNSSKIDRCVRMTANPRQILKSAVGCSIKRC